MSGLGRHHVGSNFFWYLMPSRKITSSLVVGVAVVAVAGGGYGIVRATSSSSPAVPGSGSAGGPVSGGDASNARSGPAAGGASGTVSSVSSTSFIMTTATGQGSGTITSGAAANKATEAALAAYPGGIVDRVVKLSNGDYNVHYIGVNWPHHIFVDQDFNVIGAE